MTLPAGVTLGDAGSDAWGSAYEDGKKIIGVVAGHFQLADGSFGSAATDADWQTIADAENAQTATQAYADHQYQNQIDSSTTSPEVRTLLQNPEWKALQGTGPINWNALSDTLKAQIQAIPNLYNNLIAGAWTPATSTPSGPATTSAATPATNATPSTSTPTAGGGTASDVTAPITRLMDLVAAQYGGGVAGNSGGGGGGGGGGILTLSSPQEIQSGTASGGTSPVKIVIVIAVVAIAIYWFHHKGKKAA